MQKFSLFALAVWLVVFGIVLARRVIIAYRRAIRIFNETQADDIGTYIEWLSIFTYWAVIFGVGCGLLTFLPDKYVFIWILLENIPIQHSLQLVQRVADDIPFPGEEVQISQLVLTIKESDIRSFYVAEGIAHLHQKTVLLVGCQVAEFQLPIFGSRRTEGTVALELAQGCF